MAEDQVAMAAAIILAGHAANAGTQRLSDSSVAQAVNMARKIINEVEHTTPIVTFLVAPTVGPGGTVDPNTPYTMNENDVMVYTVTPDSGNVATITSSNGGELVGDKFTTGPIVADTTVDFTFAPPADGVFMGKVVKGKAPKKEK